MLKRKLIIASGAIAVIPLFFIGSFLLYWGAWSRLFGHGTRPAGLDDIMIVSGGFIIFIGIYVASMLVSYLLRKGRRLRATSLDKKRKSTIIVFCAMLATKNIEKESRKGCSK